MQTIRASHALQQSNGERTHAWQVPTTSPTGGSMLDLPTADD
jgi:hypothetical protein